MQDGRWEKEEADAEINRGTSKSTTYLLILYIFFCNFLSAILLTVGAENFDAIKV